ncbi:MAG: CesT family type III secretion system chaperone, partial [Ramlibacter sp.]
ENGVLAFTATVRAVDVTVTHDPALQPGHVAMFVTFGPVPRHRQLEVYRDLLHNNLLLVQAGAPAFSLNPFDDQVILQYMCPLFEASGANLWAGLQGVIDGALQWREALAQALPPDTTQGAGTVTQSFA